MKSFLILLSGVLTLSGFLFAGDIPLPDKEQIVRVGNGTEPREIDPGKAIGVPESRIIDNLFEGLMRNNAFTLVPEPAQAEKVEISEDGKTYTFTLRKGLTWSDGTAITAEDFKWSWLRALSPELASEYAYQFYPITNAEAYNTNKLKDPSKVGLSVSKDNTQLIVKLDQPVAYFLSLVAFTTYRPVPKHVIDKFKGSEVWTRAKNIVTNGPFILAEWNLNQHMKLLPNPKYRAKDKVRIKEAYIYPVEDVDTEEKMFFSGKLDITYEVPKAKIPRYLKDKKAHPEKYHPYLNSSQLAVYFYRLNTTKPPLNDVRVREALSLTLNRYLLTEKVTLGGELPAQSLTPPGVIGYEGPKILNTTVTPADVEKAKKLLADAGYPGGKDFPQIDIQFNTSEAHKKVAIAVQQMWKHNLGINIGLYNKEWKVLQNDELTMNFTISRMGWIGDYNDANTFLNLFVKDGLNNKTGWSNTQYDKYILDAAGTQDPKLRSDSFTKAETILLAELPIIPVYHYTKPRLVSEHLKMVDENGKVVAYTPNITDRLFLDSFVMTK